MGWGTGITGQKLLQRITQFAFEWTSFVIFCLLDWVSLMSAWSLRTKNQKSQGLVHQAPLRSIVYSLYLVSLVTTKPKMIKLPFSSVWTLKTPPTSSHMTNIWQQERLKQESSILKLNYLQVVRQPWPWPLSPHSCLVVMLHPSLHQYLFTSSQRNQDQVSSLRAGRTTYGQMCRCCLVGRYRLLLMLAGW